MDFSNPFGTMVLRKMAATELARAIMQDIAAELDAVAVYQAHIDATIGDLTTLEDEASVEEIVRAYQELKKAEEEAK